MHENVVKKVKNQHALNGRAEYTFSIVPECYRNHHTKFEIDRTILTCLI